MDELFYRIALSRVVGVGSHGAKQLMIHCGNAKQVFSTPVGRLLKIPGIRTEVSRNIKNPLLFKETEKIMNQALKSDIAISCIMDESYPKALREINDAPFLLYSKGNTETHFHKTIAVVGTRKASPYGKQCLEQMLFELTPWNPIVVSGLAYGIDITAHRLCLELGLKTIGVLGSGINVIYPNEHHTTAQHMCQQGGLLSEYSPGTNPEMYHFPARNRIIAGLCEAVLVAEAGEKGGALITAQLANAYNREVMAIPGNLNHALSKGCNNLIKNNQAHLVTSGKDIAELLNWDIASPSASKFKLRDPLLMASLTSEELTLYELVEQHEGIQLDELSWKSNISISKTANLVLQLEMNGLIQMLPGKKIRIT